MKEPFKQPRQSTLVHQGGGIVTDEHGPDVPEQRKYLPTFSDLIDRLSIVLLKSIFIPENRKAYLIERDLIEHDIQMLVQPLGRGDGPDTWTVLGAKEIRAILMIMLSNRYIWENESAARAGGAQQEGLLRKTHAVNGVRNTAKNVLAKSVGDRIDLKIDCIATDNLLGNWNVWDDA